MKRSLLIAAVVLAVVAAAVFYFNPRETAVITVSKVQLYAAQSTSTQAAGGFGVIGSAPETSNDLYVVVTLQVENKLRLPIFFNGITTTYTTKQDTVQEERALSIADETRVEETFPALTAIMPQPLSSQAGVEAKSIAEGQLLFHFSGFTEAMWKDRKTATLTLNLQHQNSITVTLPQ
jgi:hypothetical protein